MGKAWKATMIGHHSHELSEEIGHSMALPMIVEALGPHGYMDMLLEIMASPQKLMSVYIYLSMYPSTYLSIYLSIYLYIFIFIH